ncbi:MAG: hypothetical protein ACK5MZ_01110 [Aestuariibaculum sp.]
MAFLHMRPIRHFLARLLIFAILCLVVYLFAQNAIETNSRKVHRGDVGLGIAILIFNVLLVMGITLLIDIIYRIRKKQYAVLLTN